MVLTPLAIAALNFIRRRARPSIEGLPKPEGLTGVALVIGFGRVGQIASQYLFARGYEISIIDTDVEMVEVARQLGFEVYYGDGTRLDILHAAGAEHAHVAMICVDKAVDGTRITELIKAEFPHVPVLARAVDRVHSLDLIHAGVDVQVRETFESSLVLGAAALEQLGASQAEIAEITARVRERDQQRMAVELERGLMAGRQLFNARFVAGNESADDAIANAAGRNAPRLPEQED
jgi:glutathione-regulated potassium-efflux system protein KefB